MTRPGAQFYAIIPDCNKKVAESIGVCDHGPVFGGDEKNPPPVPRSEAGCAGVKNPPAAGPAGPPAGLLPPGGGGGM